MSAVIITICSVFLYFTAMVIGFATGMAIERKDKDSTIGALTIFTAFLFVIAFALQVSA